MTEQPDRTITNASGSMSHEVRRTGDPIKTPTQQEKTIGGRAKDTLHTISMTIPVVGALGTMVVWAAANFYVGDVEIVTNKNYPDMVVNVYSAKGQGSTYHISKFQLMPGTYHVEVSTDGKNKIASDIEVQFHAKNRIFIDANTASARTTRTNIPMDADRAFASPPAPTTPVDGTVAPPQDATVPPTGTRPGEEQDSDADKKFDSGVGRLMGDDGRNPTAAPVAPAVKAPQAASSVSSIQAPGTPAQPASPQAADGPAQHQPKAAPERNASEETSDQSTNSAHHHWWHFNRKESEKGE